MSRVGPMSDEITIEVRPNLLAFWLRAKLTLTDTMLTGNSPDTFFGVIPVGRTEVSQPLNRVSRVEVSSRPSLAGLLVAAIFGVIAYASSAAGTRIVLVVLALVAVGLSFRAGMVITDSGGGRQSVSVSPLDSADVRSLVGEVNRRLAAGPV